MLTRTTLLIAASLVCFVIGFLLAVHALSGGNVNAWALAGLAFFAAAHLPYGAP